LSFGARGGLSCESENDSVTSGLGAR